jgi:hypothetical protein
MEWLPAASPTPDRDPQLANASTKSGSAPRGDYLACHKRRSPGASVLTARPAIEDARLIGATRATLPYQQYQTLMRCRQQNKCEHCHPIATAAIRSVGDAPILILQKCHSDFLSSSHHCRSSAKALACHRYASGDGEGAKRNSQPSMEAPTAKPDGGRGFCLLDAWWCPPPVLGEGGHCRLAHECERESLAA